MRGAGWNGHAPGGDGFGGCSFFWGAETLRVYGGGGSGDSRQLTPYVGKVAATQLETAWARCRDSDEAIADFGAAVACALRDFVEHFYGPQVQLQEAGS